MKLNEPRRQKFLKTRTNTKSLVQSATVPPVATQACGIYDNFALVCQVMVFTAFPLSFLLNANQLWVTTKQKHYSKEKYLI